MSATSARARTIDNIELAQVNLLKWSPDQREQSLNIIVSEASSKAKEVSGWYLWKKASKQKWAIRYRGGAILCTALAAILPIIAQWRIPWYGRQIPPAVPSIVLAIAALFIALDQFGGFSSAWMRFISAEMKVKSLHSDFHADYEIERASWNGQPPNDVQVRRILTMTKSFIQALNSVVEDETNSWIQEFRSNLKNIEDQAKAASTATEAGAINLIVDNGDQCPNGWTVSIDDANPLTKRGKTAGFSNVFQGKHKIRVTGEIAGAHKSAEMIVDVKAGQVAPLTLTLN